MSVLILNEDGSWAPAGQDDVDLDHMGAQTGRDVTDINKATASSFDSPLFPPSPLTRHKPSATSLLKLALEGMLAETEFGMVFFGFGYPPSHRLQLTSVLILQLTDV